MYLLYVPLACSAPLQLEGIYDWELTGAQGYSCSSFPGPRSLHRFLFPRAYVMCVTTATPLELVFLTAK